MKKILWACAMLVLLTAFCWWTSWRVERLCGKTAEYLEQAETQVLLGDYPAAEALLEDSSALWERHELFFGMALRHTEADGVSILLPGLQEACRQKDGQEYLLRTRELSATLRQLSRIEQPYLFNIL